MGHTSSTARVSDATAASEQTHGCVLFAGGGTGGHLFPGIAVAREVTRRHPSWRVVFVGSGRALEVRVLSREGFPFERVRSVGLVGKSVTAVARGLVTLPASLFDAWRLLRRYHPRVVVGLGGYSSGPLVLLAGLLRLPTMLLEQNVVPGVTNRLLTPIVTAAAVSYDASLPAFGRRGFVSGNPVRSGFFDAPDIKPGLTELHLLVLGGSQGAHSLNVAMVDAAPRLAALSRTMRVTHQSGEADLDHVRDGYHQASLAARVEPFFDRMDELMASADLVFCRAGATTLAELAASGRPAILVPYPHATHDHQRRNAAVVRDAGAADVIDPRELTASTLVDTVRALAEDDTRRLSMAVASRRLGRPDATVVIADRIDELAGQRVDSVRPAEPGRVLTCSTRVHLVGVGGIGMSGIAELLVNLGHEVTGSDRTRSAATDRLQSLGVRVAEGHDVANIGAADVVVTSTAVPSDNPERVAAIQRGIPVISRGAMLAELTATRRTVAVAGSHGKTTTSSMVAVVLEAAGLDPTAAIGGRLEVFGSNARLGSGPFMVVEADESDRSFLLLAPDIAVITNIDDEHLEAYAGMDDLDAAFLEFAGRGVEHGCVVACADDPRVRRILSKILRRVVTYGINPPAADVRASSLRLDSTGSSFAVTISSQTQGWATTGPPVDAARELAVTLAVPGRHNVLNALATFAVAVELGIAPDKVATALATFAGAERRFQQYGMVDNVVVVDDYAHHPTEVVAVLETARLQNPTRLRVVFQPHRYTRTLRLLDRFAEALSLADELILTEVYAASEPPLPGATSEALARAVEERAARDGARSLPVQVTSLADVVELVVSDARPGDLIVTLGAGSIGSIPARITAALRARGPR